MVRFARLERLQTGWGLDLQKPSKSNLPRLPSGELSPEATERGSRPVRRRKSLPCARGGVTSSQTGDGRVVIYRSLTISQARPFMQVTIPHRLRRSPLCTRGPCPRTVSYPIFCPAGMKSLLQTQISEISLSETVLSFSLYRASIRNGRNAQSSFTRPGQERGIL